jgi:hypothetical protein
MNASYLTDLTLTWLTSIILSISLTADGRRNLTAFSLGAILPMGSGNDLTCLTSAMPFASGLASPAQTLNLSIDLIPGVYTVAAAVSLTGTLTLDSKGDSNAVWIFQIGGAFTTTAASQMVFFLLIVALPITCFGSSTVPLLSVRGHPPR